MKERPILFSGPMVRAILDCRKTQTRRLVKVPSWGTGNIEVDGTPSVICRTTGCMADIACPYGVPGDRLWVRETWFDNGSDWNGNSDKTPARCVYRADGEFCDHFPEDYMHAKWTPSIHMLRWASRITLEITGVRCERLQSISEADALAEGIIKEQIPDENDGDRCSDDDIGYKVTESQNGFHLSAIASFHSLWNSINGPESWDANPWVWVVEFNQLGEQK